MTVLNEIILAQSGQRCNQSGSILYKVISDGQCIDSYGFYDGGNDFQEEKLNILYIEGSGSKSVPNDNLFDLKPDTMVCSGVMSLYSMTEIREQYPNKMMNVIFRVLWAKVFNGLTGRNDGELSIQNWRIHLTFEKKSFQSCLRKCGIFMYEDLVRNLK
ncbi:tubulin beta chain-like isoform X6 [Octopus vulgaris]|uniref:Tubulin beta chain-like isoform X6 n=1 Tax=Octopus vulgaris TaxID=6645 RepID=A0AA36BRB6_OCTVU|nr:tubulin beta chain-like isoform X6 [Octopus vulgaris]